MLMSKSYTFIFSDYPGIMFTEGSFWQEQRRFTLRHLRDLGFGKTSHEDMMLDEIQELLSEISAAAEADPDRVVNYKGIFSISLINVLWGIVGGERYLRDDQYLKRLLRLLDTNFRSGNAIRATIPVPIIVFKVFPKLRDYFGTRNDLFKEIVEYIQVKIELISLYIPVTWPSFLSSLLANTQKHSKKTSPEISSTFICKKLKISQFPIRLLLVSY